MRLIRGVVLVTLLWGGMLSSAFALGFYADGQLGMVDKHAASEASHIITAYTQTDLALNEDNLALNQQDFSWAYGADVGLKLFPHLALEGGYIKFQETQALLQATITGTTPLPEGTAFNIKYDNYYVAVNAFYHFQRFYRSGVFLKAGMDAAYRTISGDRASALAAELGTKTRWVPILGAGISQRLYRYVVFSATYWHFFKQSNSDPLKQLPRRDLLLFGLGFDFNM